jgi:hypothetical protein
MYAGHLQVGKGIEETIELSEPAQNVLRAPRPFVNEEALKDGQRKKSVSSEYLVNRLNYLHFTGRKAFASLHHPRYSATILVRVSPDPCTGKEIICRWADDSFENNRSHEYSLRHLIMEDRHNLLVVPAQISHRIENGFGINLPCECYISGMRRHARYGAPGVIAEINQDGWTASGGIIDFSPRGIRLMVRPVNSPSLHWFNCSEPLLLTLKRDNRSFFSGMCFCIRTSDGYDEKEIVVAPSTEPVRRFPKNQTRNPRQQLLPPPVITFVHPLLNRKVTFRVADISTSGLSVWESAEEEILLKGMMIPRMTIETAGGVKIECSCQVIYRKEEADKRVKCGLAIIDMDIKAYSALSHMLSNAMDPNTHVSREVDLDALWEFFFASGFIYSSKYKIINNNRESFKYVYNKLYNEHPDIARHFTFQDNGTIYGHISIIRAYPKTWMIHHHAALAHDNKRAGFTVLKHLMHNLNDMHRFPSAKMDNVLCYYRPDNTFPSRVFGGFAEELKDPSGCSVDRFAYLPYTRLSLMRKLQQGWSLAESSSQDLWELQRAYETRSGGLLLKALDLTGASGREELEQTYAAHGLKRRTRSHSLCEQGILKAVILVNESDLGINLSELLNCIQVLILDPEGMPWSVLSSAIGMLSAESHADKVPVMFFPHTYAEIQGVPYEKTYEAWVLNCGRGSSFMDYMQRRFRVRFQ